MTATLPATRRLYRRPDLGRLGGVVSGIAEHTGLRRRTVAFLFLAFTAAGVGVALYAAYWIVLPTPPGLPSTRRSLPTWLEYVLIAVVLALATGVVIWQGLGGSYFVPTLLAVVGGAFIWRQASDPGSRLTSDVARARLAIGAVLVISGGAIVLGGADFTAARDGLLAMLVTVIGIALLTGPWWIGLASQLGHERAERIRSQERADIAAHLHDSVLQTLALIQRNAESPREVARLARGQERELRELLYGKRTPTGHLADELRAVAAEVEDAYAIAVDVIVVGDSVLDERLSAAVAAAREAIVNAAKHADVTSVSIYAEAEADAVSIYVRDRGIGFDPQTVAEDRQGLRGSIVARVERYGGSATIRSAPAEGTEVMIRMPIS